MRLLGPLLALYAALASAGSCKLSLNVVVDSGYWMNTGRRKDTSKIGSSGLTLQQKMGILLNPSEERKILMGRLYSYLTQLKFDPKKDKNFKDIQEKRAAHARDLLHEIDVPAWSVAETTLSNGDIVFLGYWGHFLKVKKDGRLLKGNLHSKYSDVTEEMLLRAKEEELEDLDPPY
ncbi:MAG: hypothetical protein R3A80_01435 [Bdellovibrionota bacterium]